MIKHTIVITLILIVGVGSLQAQDVFFERQTQKNGFVSFAKVKSEKSKAARAEAGAIVKRIVGDDASISFSRLGVEAPARQKQDMQLQQEKYQLYKNGVRLRGAEYVVNVVNDSTTFVHGFLAPVSDEPFTYDASSASALAVAHFNKSHKIEDAASASAGSASEATQLYYYDNAAGTFRASWQIRVTSKNMAFSENIFISAATGVFLGAESLMCSINFPGTGQTLYSGAKNIVTDAPSAAGPFRLQETRSNISIRTRNMNSLPGLTNVTEFTDNDNNWTAAEHGSNLAAVDAHWAAETVVDYWLTVHNRSSLNGSQSQPVPIESYVHWKQDGEPWTFNARWTGSAIYYGDGFGGASPLTTLDIGGHELGHGIDQYTGNLLYERESGALDEAFADIWGASVEAWAAPTKSRWLMGEEVFGGPIRDMANPNAHGDPDTYMGTYWVNQTGCTPSNDNDACGVHTNSGVLNYWFYLVSQGGTGTNDIGNVYNVSGLGITVAERIAYATKQLMNSSNVDYALCRELSIQATTNLYGANSCALKTVAEAWYAVGLGAPPNATLGLSIGGSLQVCTSPVTLTINNAPAGAAVSWQSSNPAALSIDAVTGVATRQNNFNGNVVVSATVNIGCGNINLTKDIWVGPTYGGLALDGSNLCCDYWRYVETGSHTLTVFRYGRNSNGSNANVNIQITRSLGGTSYPPTYYNSTANTVSYTWSIPPHHYGETYNFYVTSSNGCGSTWTRAATVTTDANAEPPITLVAYPNPASTVLTVQLADRENQSAAIEQPYRLELFRDQSLEVVHSVSSTEKEISIPVSKLPNGIYYLNIHYKDRVVRKQIVVNK